ncbi:MAG: NifB/NifX family molybdenum-iron cluster-binding protein, partial [Candidatus Altiarchaeota archaeon]|nr:NifB/NifX family molybdenum-iron cluster-binding protein [Candidatus Altiarchaeota archaeon]
MKIAIATQKGGLDDEVSPFFGRCPVFTMVYVEGEEIKNSDVIQNESASATGGAGIQAAQFIVEQKAEAVMAGNFGPNAARILSSAGIKMVPAQGNVKEAVMKYLSGDLKPVPDSTVEGHFGMGGGMGRGQGQGMG